MSRAYVTAPSGSVKSVKNLGWFFKKARTTVIDDFSMTKMTAEWLMRVVFDDGYIFSTNYADLTVFGRVMNRQRSLRGVIVHVVDGDKMFSLRLGGRR